MRVAWWPGGRRDDGSVAIEAAIVLPSLIMFLCLAIAGGRIVTSSARLTRLPRMQRGRRPSTALRPPHRALRGQRQQNP